MPDLAAQHALESRYRWLLACYPRDHRERHEEEMLGVLMADAEPTQTRPGVRETADLLGAGLRLHVRRAFGGGSGELWRTACGAGGVVGLVIALLYVGRRLGAVLGGSGIVETLHGPGRLGILALVLLGTLLAAARELRWVTVTGAWLSVVLAIGLPVLGPSISDTSWLGYDDIGRSYDWFQVVVLAAAVLVSFAPLPGHVLRGPSRSRFLLWCALAAGAMLFSTPTVTGMTIGRTDNVPIAVLGAVAAVVAFRSPLGRRVIVLLAIPYAAYLSLTTLQAWRQTYESAEHAAWLVGLPLAVLVSGSLVAGYRFVRNRPRSTAGDLS